MSERLARTAATVFTVAIHAALAVGLVLTVAWKNQPTSPPNVLSVELYAPKTSAPALPAPAPSSPPSTPQETSPSTPVAPLPPPAPSDAQIALKKKEAEITLRREKALLEEKARLRAEAERKEREKRKREEDALAAQERLRREADRDAMLREFQAQADRDKRSVEQDWMAKKKAEQERAQREAAAKEAAAKEAAAKLAAERSAAEAAAQRRALEEYVNKIRNKVRGNLVIAQEIPGNPTAVFEITQLVSGEVVGVQLRRSSGNRVLDEAIERAVRKSSPLPKPDQPELFQRTLILQVRPND